MKSLILILSFVLTSQSFALLVEQKKLDKKTKSALSSVKVETGGLIILEQFIKEKNRYNGKDDYKLEFKCKKTSRKTKCQVIKYEILTRKVNR